MGAWIAQAGAEGYWLQEANTGSSGLQLYAEKPCKNRCRLDSGRPLSVKEEEEEESRRRMVELMLGPCKYLYKNSQQRLQYGDEAAQLPTLDLLNAAPASSLLMNYSCSTPVSSMDSTPIELEPDSPLPTGWEKCLDLKTGSIYYLNRSTGLNSSVDPRQAPVYDGKSGRGADLNSWPSSPTASEVTIEASSLKSNAKQVPLNLNEKLGGDEGALDLNLSLHLGQSPSKLPPQNVSEAENASLVLPAQLKVPSSVPSASSSSSSITSFPSSSSFHFPNSSMSSKEARPCPSLDFDSIINKQDISNLSWLVPKESMYTSSDRPLSELSPRSTETIRALEHGGHGTCNAPMVTVACANCLMFVMLSRSNPKCPRCGTCPDHLDFPQPPLKRAKLGFSVQ